MNKAELIEALSVHYDGSKTEAAKALNAVVSTITYKTAAGEKVSITGFGVFEKVHRSERMVRNPRTGERKKAEATAVPRFRAGTDLKAYVAGEKKVPKTATGPAEQEGRRQAHSAKKSLLRSRGQAEPVTTRRSAPARRGHGVQPLAGPDRSAGSARPPRRVARLAGRQR